jgi:hypothetical protein
MISYHYERQFGECVHFSCGAPVAGALALQLKEEGESTPPPRGSYCTINIIYHIFTAIPAWTMK